METVPCGITLREDEFPTVEIDVVDRVEDFVEEVDELYGVGWGTDTVVHHGHVCYVAVIFFIEIDAIPAGLEVDLCS